MKKTLFLALFTSALFPFIVLSSPHCSLPQEERPSPFFSEEYYQIPLQDNQKALLEALSQEILESLETAESSYAKATADR